ncbi:MAG TPA: hypothetical protein VK503_10165 [Candidatus Bathyarchaeia archaeon]|nr:hypothetical protein [Candidatus Bathyarchaeia archaeon]
MEEALNKIEKLAIVTAIILILGSIFVIANLPKPELSVSVLTSGSHNVYTVSIVVTYYGGNSFRAIILDASNRTLQTELSGLEATPGVLCSWNVKVYCTSNHGQFLIQLQFGPLSHMSLPLKAVTLMFDAGGSVISKSELTFLPI